MSLEIKKQQIDKEFKALYPIASEVMRKKTYMELNRRSFKLHKNFARYFFSGFSFFLYLPTFIAIYIKGSNFNDYLLLVVAIAIGLGVEIGLAIISNDFFERKWGPDLVTKTLKYSLYICAFFSIFFSSVCGANMVEITDNSELTIIEKNRDNKKQDMEGYYAMLNKNDKIVQNNMDIIKQNNALINNLKQVALTRKGASQINSLNQRNKEISIQNDRLISDNIDIRQQIKEATSFGNSLMQSQLLKAGNKELIYMVIFFLSGIVAVFGILFSNNQIYKFFFYMKKEADELESLDELIEDETMNEIDRKARKARILKESEIRNIELDKALEKKRSESDLPTIEWDIPPIAEKKKQNHFGLRN